MSGEKLFDLIGKIDDKYLEEIEKEKEKMKFPFKPLLVAASVLLVGTSVLMLNRDNLKEIANKGKLEEKGVITSELEVDKNLPKLAITDFSGDGMGFSGESVFDKSELKSANPWDKSWDLKVLPVYKNKYYSEGYAINKEFKLSEMKKKLVEIASDLGFNIDENKIKVSYYEDHDFELYERISGKEFTDNKEEYASEVQYTVNGYLLNVDKYGNASLDFNDDTAIYTSQDLDLKDTNASREEMKKIGEFLLENYPQFISLEKPKMLVEENVQLDGSYYYELNFYEGSDEDFTNMINFQLGKKVQVLVNELGNITSIHYFLGQKGEKIGNYPLITLDEATEKFKNGNYISNVPEELIGDLEIGYVDLVYRNSYFDEYAMPYYLFYGELDEDLGNGLKSYGMFWVPAVEDQYLENISLYDGYFN